MSDEMYVQATRYEVSVLPRTDVNRRVYTLLVELERQGDWYLHDGHGGYTQGGD